MDGHVSAFEDILPLEITCFLESVADLPNDQHGVDLGPFLLDQVGVQFYTFIVHLIAVALPLVLRDLAHVLSDVLALLYPLIERFACDFVEMFGQLFGGP